MTAFTLNVQSRARSFPMVIELDPQRPPEQTILGFLQGSRLYEQDIAEVMMRAVEPGDVVLDVGANVGFFTLFMGLLTGPTGRVVSFEPADDNLGRLRQNIGLNNLTNVTVLEQPASHSADEVTFYLNSDTSGGHAIWDPGSYPANELSRANPRMIKVRATTVDAEVARLGLATPKLIKIDTEGAEHSVLQGASGLLATHAVPYIIAELHDFGLGALGSSQQALRQYMRTFGYETFGLYLDGALPKLFPADTHVASKYFFNILFSTPEDVGKLWPRENFDATSVARA